MKSMQHFIGLKWSDKKSYANRLFDIRDILNKVKTNDIYLLASLNPQLISCFLFLTFD